MFLYELGVAPAARKRGVATELLRTLAALATARGCYGIGSPSTTTTRLAAYRRAGAQEETGCVVQSGDFTTP